MTVQLMTGNTGSPVTGASDRRLYAGIIGKESYVQDIGKRCEAYLANANKLIVENGSLVHNGAHIDLNGNTEFTIPSGVQGKKRATLCGVLYTADADGTENAEEKTYTGEAVDTGNAPDPEYPDGNILDGATESFMPLYKVVTDGIIASDPIPLFNVLTPAAEAWDSISQTTDNGWSVIPIGKIRICYLLSSGVFSGGNGYFHFCNVSFPITFKHKPMAIANNHGNYNDTSESKYRVDYGYISTSNIQLRAASPNGDLPNTVALGYSILVIGEVNE